MVVVPTGMLRGRSPVSSSRKVTTARTGVSSSAIIKRGFGRNDDDCCIQIKKPGLSDGEEKKGNSIHENAIQSRDNSWDNASV